MFGGSIEAAVLGLVLMLGLPQLGGLLVTRAARVAWPAWPAAAIAVFAAFWYAGLWRPASRAAAESQQHCGMWVLAAGFFFAAGIIVHLIAGTVFAVLVRRRRAAHTNVPPL